MDIVLEKICMVNSYINSIVWGPFMLFLFLTVGLMFSIKLKFFQVTHFKIWIKHTLGSFFTKNNKPNKSQNGITSFQALTTALAGAIGTGNIVGVATAISLGGSGAIFWMWLSSILGMMTIFAENVLGVKYRQKNSNGEYVGGPMYYIEKGLGQKWLAVLFAVFCIFATLGMGNMTQSNSIAAAMYSTFSIKTKYTAVVLCIIVGLIIFGGVKRIVKVTEKIVPFMAIFYLLGGLIVIFTHVNSMPTVICNIFNQVFSFKASSGGIIGIGVSQAIKYGIARGVFSNEAGLGSSPIIYAASSEKNPVIQGMFGVFQVFFDTIIGCSVTAFCILCTDAVNSKKEGVSLSIYAFSSYFGRFGSLFVTFSIIMFAFSTLIGWSYCGEKSLEYICGHKYIPIYKAFYVIIVLFGCVMDLSLVWDISDTFNGLMAIPNLVALIVLCKQVIDISKKYKIK